MLAFEDAGFDLNGQSENQMRYIFAICLAVCGLAHGTTLPFEDNLNSASAACWAARQNGETGTQPCGEWLDIGKRDASATPIHNGFSYRPDLGAVECTYERDERYCQARIVFAPTDEIWVRFRMKFDSTFDFSGGQKTFRISANPASGLKTDHIVFIHSSNEAAWMSEADAICGDNNMGNGGGSGQYGCASGPIQRDVWKTYLFHFKMNSFNPDGTNKSDGVFEMEIDGVSKIHETAINNYRSSAVPQGFDVLSIGGWTSSYSTPKVDPSHASTYWIDDFRASLTNDFGPLPDVLFANGFD
ncbi:MAG: hypothetical protein ABI411_17145 [Tahibacter sp.]